HELRAALPCRRRAGPADRSGATGQGRGPRAGGGLLLSRTRRLAVAALAIAAALLPQAAQAHALLLQSDPAAGALLQSAPERVTLVFSEPVTPAGTGIKVYAPSGRQVRRREGYGWLVVAGVGLLILAEPISFLGQLASLSFDGDTAIAVLGSGFGRILGLRLGAALLAWTLLATDRAWAVLAVGAAMAALDGASAHAFPQLPVAGQAVVAVHVSAMGLWAGGMAAFLRTPDARFARYAALTF